jgi:hypothetical protein
MNLYINLKKRDWKPYLDNLMGTVQIEGADDDYDELNDYVKTMRILTDQTRVALFREKIAEGLDIDVE